MMLWILQLVENILSHNRPFHETNLDWCPAVFYDFIQLS